MRAIFLDRDGTIIRDKNYIRDPSQVELLPRAGDALYLLQREGFKLIIITNQSGIKRGLFTKEDLYRVNKKLRYLLSFYDVRIDAMYYSPDLPSDKSSTRKPSPLLALKACQKFDINPRRSFVIGDSDEDVEMGKALGSITVLIDPNKDETINIMNDKPNYICKDLFSAAEKILRRVRVERNFAPRFVSRL